MGLRSLFIFDSDFAQKAKYIKKLM